MGKSHKSKAKTGGKKEVAKSGKKDSKSKKVKKVKSESSREASDLSSSSDSDEKKAFADAQKALTTVAMAFGLKAKSLQINLRTQMHLRDLTASQLATLLSGLLPSLSPITIMKLGGDVLQVRRSLTVQSKNQTGAAKADENAMEMRMSYISKESSAERMWKDRLLEILQILLEMDGLFLIRPHSHLASVSQLIKSTWSCVEETTKNDRVATLATRTAEWMRENAAELRELNSINSPMPRRAKSRADISASEDQDELENSDFQDEEEEDAEDASGKLSKRRKSSLSSAKRALSFASDSSKHRARMPSRVRNADDSDLFNARYHNKREKEPALKPQTTPAKRDEKELAKEPEPSCARSDGVFTQPPWLDAIMPRVSQYLRKPDDAKLFVQMLVKDGLDGDSLEDFFQAAFPSDTDGVGWCGDELGSDAKKIYATMSFGGKKQFNALCVHLAKHKDDILAANSTADPGNDAAKDTSGSPGPGKLELQSLQSRLDTAIADPPGETKSDTQEAEAKVADK